ncbi:MAG TPA: NADH-quinone oxidoreductase subunit NuoK [Armatimonadota bacterium]|jgi:NADH:ubiquinone oxidoreductase subunit K
MSGHLAPYLIISAGLFSLGLFGALTRRNAVAVLMGIELMLNAANLNLIAFNRFLGPGGASTVNGMPVDGSFTPLLAGHAFAVVVITIAAAEAAVGLAIILTIYKNARTINVDEINWMRW